VWLQLGEQRQQRAQRRPLLAQQLGGQQVAWQAPQQVIQGVDEEAIGETGVLHSGVADHHQHPAGTRLVGQRVAEAALAQPGLAGEEDRLGQALECQVERLAELGQLGIATDEGRAEQRGGRRGRNRYHRFKSSRAASPRMEDRLQHGPNSRPVVPWGTAPAFLIGGVRHR